MIKSKTVLEVKIGERVYSMYCDADSPLGEVHDAVTQMRACVVQKMVDLDKSKEEPKDEYVCLSSP